MLFCDTYRPFYKTLPRSNSFVNWISARFYETGCTYREEEKTRKKQPTNELLTHSQSSINKIIIWDAENLGIVLVFIHFLPFFLNLNSCFLEDRRVTSSCCCCCCCCCCCWIVLVVSIVSRSISP